MKTTLGLLRSILYVFVLLAFGTRAFGQPSSPSVLVYNTNQPDFGSFPVVEAAQWLAMPFTTGGNASLFTAATIYEKTFTPDGNFWVSIYSDNNGVPGSVLTGGLLNGPNMPTGFSFINYSATQPIPLAANTTYWIVAASDSQARSGGAYGWAYAANNNYTSPSGWTLGYFDFTGDGGNSWTSSANYTPTRLLTGIDGIIVPEPSSVALLVAGLAILAGYHVKR